MIVNEHWSGRCNKVSRQKTHFQTATGALMAAWD